MVTVVVDVVDVSLVTISVVNVETSTVKVVCSTVAVDVSFAVVLSEDSVDVLLSSPKHSENSPERKHSQLMMMIPKALLRFKSQKY